MRRLDHRRRLAARLALFPAIVALVLLAATTMPPAFAATPRIPSHKGSLLFEAKSQKPSGQWSMFMFGPLRRGRTPIVGAQTSTLAWRIPAETNYGGPVIGRDGTVYQGTFAGKLLALNPDGTTRWTVSVPYIVESTPAILPDGRIVFVDDGGTVYAVNPDGSPSWRLQTGGVFDRSSPAVGRDGTIYTAGWDTLYAVYPDGSLRWSYELGEHITGPPAVTRQGVVYLHSTYLYALNPNGSLRWRTSDPLGLGGAPVVGFDGTIYVNSAVSPTFYAFNPDGTEKWTYVAGNCCGGEASSPAIGPDGTIYVGETVLDDGMVLAFNPDGSVKWESHHGRDPTAISIGGDGTIYFGAYTDGISGPLYALNPDGTLKWQYDDPGGGYVRTPPAIGLHQRVYGGSISGFFAIGP